jgi:hypothetical protein
MKRKRNLTIVFAGLVLAVLVVGIVQAEAGNYRISRWVAGGGESAGSAYTLAGAIGQSSAGPLAGQSYRLQGGYWTGGQSEFQSYLPLLMR